MTGRMHVCHVPPCFPRLHYSIRYGRNYHSERNHQGLGNELLIRSETRTTATGPVACHKRRGGLLNYYRRGAARGRLLARVAQFVTAPTMMPARQRADGRNRLG